MVLTEKYLKTYLKNHRISMSDSLKEDLLNDYGSSVVDDQGRLREYTEQDICEQIRKIVLK
ncbi:hypothetical protein [Alkaliphilus metalliredigens]|uniref:hypothetical protein n=1 Tax=Alkaliphilus metalliredigens TaxID=208226 RepID=UPI0002EB32F9|nr:hypothetical protein [Alkaliphilus metalliredigens]